MASPIKILVFSPYYPPHIGGLESHAHEFNLHMAKRGHTITIYTPQIPHIAASIDTTYPSMRIIRFPAFEIIPGYPAPKVWSLSFWRQLHEIKKNSYDIVISRTRFFLTSLMALSYAKIYNIKYVHVEHGSDFVQLDSRINSLIAKIYDYTLGKLIFFSADTIVANSNASAKFVKKITHNKITPLVIYRGIEPSIMPMEKISPQTTDPIILYVGRLIDGKGVQDLIHAFAKVQEQQWVAWIVGDGPCYKKLKSMTHQLGLDSRIRFWGEQSHAQALAYIDAADILINPSHTEGMPTTVVEAARAGKAIIATNVGGTSEVITDKVTGLLYSSQNIDALAQDIAFFLKSKEARVAFGNNARESMRGRFSWESAMVKYEHVWNKR